MIETTPQLTPVNVLTGFLGSGKTTLLQRLLKLPTLRDTAVLMNEFGEVGLDHHLLERVDETTVLLQSGCLCCTIRGDLSAALRELHCKRDRGSVPSYRRLVIETTGLADPLPVLTTITAASPSRSSCARAHGTLAGRRSALQDCVHYKGTEVRSPAKIPKRILGIVIGCGATIGRRTIQKLNPRCLPMKIVSVAAFLAY